MALTRVRHIGGVIMLAALTLLGAVAPALCDEEAQLEELIRLVGLDTSYDNYAKNVAAGMAENAPSSDANFVASAEAAAQVAYNAAMMKRKLRDGLKGRLPAERLEAIFAFFKGPVGARMTEVENASMTPEAQAELRKTKDELAKRLDSEPRRAKALKRLDAALDLTGTTTETSLNLQRGVMIGMAVASGQFDATSVSRIDQLLQDSRAEHGKRLSEAVMTSLTYNYRDVGVEDLETYATFLASPDGQELYRVVRAVKSRIEVAASLEFGEALIKQMSIDRL